MRRIAAMACILLAAGSALGQGWGLPDLGGEPESSAARSFSLRAIPSHTAVGPGQTFRVALRGELAEGWKYYSPVSGIEDLDASLAVDGPFEHIATRWPADEVKPDPGFGVPLGAYHGTFAAYVEFRAPEDLAPGEYTVTIRPQGQICEEVCLRLRGRNALEASAQVSIAAEAAVNPGWTDALDAGWDGAYTVKQLRALHVDVGETGEGTPMVSAAGDVTGIGLWAGLGLAVLAGLVLNIMPCVLPVIPLRILTIVQMAGESRRRYVTMGLAFAGGIVLFFVGVAVVSGVLRVALGEALNLSDHFRLEWVRIVLAAVLVALAANLFGAFNVTVPRKLAGAEKGGREPSHVKSAGMGLMMAILATPCSFAFLATALAWAQVQPLWLGTLGILLIGAGMAVPHVLLAAFPNLVNRLPKPGRWMELFKQSMGFLLLPAVLYLLYTLADMPARPWLVAGFVVALAFGLWMGGTWVRYDAPLRRKLLVRGSAVALVVVAGVLLLPPPKPAVVEFQPFSEAALADAATDGRPVVVKVTASWCTECKILDATTYQDPATAETFAAHNALPLKADVTNEDSPASRWLERRFTGAAPPVTIVYGGAPAAKPAVLVGRYTPAELREALDKARPAE